MNADRDRYRWQDHVITPQRATADLMATALIVLLVGAATMFVCSTTTAAPDAHAATERTPPLAQLAKRPVHPHVRETWL
jgi:hypothetical protein